MATVNGTAGNDFIHVQGDGQTPPSGYTDQPQATDSDDVINPGSGNDIIFAGGGDDAIYFGANFTAADSVDGGTGNDKVVLNGDYFTTGLAFSATTMTNIETLQLVAGHSYALLTDDANVATGQTLTIDGSGLGAGDVVNFYGGRETDGNLVMLGGAGNDIFGLGQGGNVIHGGDGDDTIYADSALAFHIPVFGAQTQGHLTASDSIDGGAGFDTVSLIGNYDLTFEASTITNVEKLVLYSGGFLNPNSYHLVMNDGNVAAGQTLVVDAGRLGDADLLSFDGSAETDGNFNISGGTGNFSIETGAGNDVIGSGLAGTIDAGAGNDVVTLGSATIVDRTVIIRTGTYLDDSIHGGAGTDTLRIISANFDMSHFSAASSGFELLSGTNQVSGDANANDLDFSGFGQTASSDTLSILGQGGDDTLTAWNFGATLDGGDGNDTLIGGAGEDTLIGGAGDDTLNGGGGNDTVIYSNATAGVNVSLSVAGPQAVGGGQRSDTLISIENLTGSDFADTLRGNIGDNVVSGLGGDDTLDLSTGGNDTALGGDGNDTFLFGAALTAADRIDGGAGYDTVRLNGDYSLGVVFAATTMTNVEQLIVLAGHNYNLTLNDANVAAGQVLTVNGTALGAGDALTFDGSQETDGQFILNGGAGNDVLIGGSGGDTFVGGAGNDTINGGGGIDTVNYAAATGGVTVNLGISTAQVIGGGQGTDTLIAIENLIGSNFNDALQGSAGDNVISGGGGNDTLDLSGGGNDTALGGVGNDTILLGAAFTAADHIDGGTGADIVTLNGNYAAGVVFGAQTMINVETLRLTAGHSYNLTMNDTTVAAGATLTVGGATLGAGDTLTFDGSRETNGKFIIYGGAGNDVLTGGASNDTLVGGFGADHLKGGPGADVYAYAGAAQSTGANYDTITFFDFANADKIDLGFQVAAIDTALAMGALSTASFDTDLAASVNAAHLGKHHAILFTPNSGDLVGKTFLIVDANGIAGYQAGKDLVIQLDHAAHLSSIDVTDFI